MWRFSVERGDGLRRGHLMLNPPLSALTGWSQAALIDAVPDQMDGLCSVTGTFLIILKA